MHGGDIYRNTVTSDFSVNINPLGIPKEMTEAMREAVSHLDAYPDPQYVSLRESIGRRIGADPDMLLQGNGASESFMAIVHAVRPASALLLGPSFSGYAYALRSEDTEIIYHMLREEDDFLLTDTVLQSLGRLTKMPAPRMFFLAIPNNPNGAVVSGEVLKKILPACREAGIWLVIDECFLDFTYLAGKIRSVLDAYAFPEMIRVGAFTKTYAMPGVRLGYALFSDAAVREKVLLHLPEWNCSAFAQAVASCAFDRDKFIRDTREYVEKERSFLAASVKECGIKVFPSETNYLLLKTERPLYDEMLAKGILIRNCNDYEGLSGGFYRIAVRSSEENRKLLAALRD